MRHGALLKFGAGDLDLAAGLAAVAARDLPDGIGHVEGDVHRAGFARRIRTRGGLGWGCGLLNGRPQRNAPAGEMGQRRKCRAAANCPGANAAHLLGLAGGR